MQRSVCHTIFLELEASYAWIDLTNSERWLTSDQQGMEQMRPS